jgi:DNA (cytosine-5)-methyltransferase 1
VPKPPQPTLFPPEDAPSAFLDLCAQLKVSLGANWVDDFGAALRSAMIGTQARPIRTLSLFSGGGGLDIGFHDAGFDILEMVELEDRFVASLRANTGRGRYLGEAEARCIDICEYQPKLSHPVDFIIGGPPCQTFSAAGRRASGVQGTDDARGKLFREYVRILQTLKPAGFLFENVYGITGAQQGRAWAEITSAFATAGYRISFRILDAADYGVPQHRERIFIVGARNQEFVFPTPTHGPDSPGALPYYTAGQAVRGAKLSIAEARPGLGGRYGGLLEQIPPGLNYSFYTAELGHPNPLFAWRSKFSDFLYKADPDSPIRTLKAQGGQYTGPFHWGNRPFSVSELKRLQTFPDAYEIVGGRQVAAHQLGNSVPPQIARLLALSIREQLFGSELPTRLPTIDAKVQLGFRKRKRGLTDVYRSKAAAAISNIFCTDTVTSAPKSRAYRAHLAEDFSWQCVPTGHWKVRFATGSKCWRIDVSDAIASSNPKAGIESSSITIRPAALDTRWGLPVREVALRIRSSVPLALTAAWKALECELSRNGLKADLVQLCGYYQYAPCFSAKLEVDPRGRQGSLWRVLQLVTEGAGVRETLHTVELARAWEVDAKDVPEFARQLRVLGFEVRNRNTNPQIPAKHYLIPYAFPTLTPSSVQRRKSLD